MHDGNCAKKVEDMTLSEFLLKFGKSLGEKVSNTLTVVYDPGSENARSEVASFDEKIEGLLRTPFPVQREVISGLSLGLYNRKREKLFVGGEMGCGKTTIALSVAALTDRPMRTLVVCPTHLVEKWKRETRQVIPDVNVTDLTIKNVISLLQTLRSSPRRPTRNEVFVISKEKAKLSYGWRPAYRGDKYGNPHCPACGARAQEDDYFLMPEDLKKKKRICSFCKSPYWQADNKLKRFAPAEYIKRYLKGFFDLVIFDEVQDFKAGSSLQGKAMGSLLSAAKKCMALTGTLNGGYADDLFYLLFRMAPGELIKAGFKYSEVAQWTAAYGTLESVRKIEEEDNYYGRGKKGSVMMRKKPGVSPVVIGKYILDKACFIRLADIIEGLPPYEENVITVPMDDVLAIEYRRMENSLAKAIRQHGPKVISSMLQALLSYPDSCVLFPEKIPVVNKEGLVVEVVEAPVIVPPENLMAKERELVDLVKKERSAGRKVLCYLTFTGTRDFRPRLATILEDIGIRVKVLDVTVAPKKREAWIRKNVSDIDVLLVNPDLVKTGLDLYEFPTVVFFQVGYNVYTLRQAARRSWRIGQTEPVKVYFFCYGETMQEKALTLTAQKLETALMVEGDLPEGLAEYTATGDSLVKEMGKALVEGGEYVGAETAWASFRKKESEAQLSVNGRTTVFTEKTEKKKSKTEPLIRAKTSVKDNVSIKVTVIDDKKGRRQSTLEISHGDIDTVLEGKRVQFNLF